MIQLISLPLLCVAAGRLKAALPGGVGLAAAALAGTAVLIPALQLIEIPPGLWIRFPGRDIIANTFNETGTPLPDLSISLDHRATIVAALSLLPPISVLFATLTLDLRTRRFLTLVLIGFSLLSVLLGLAQVQLGLQNTISVQAENGYEASGLFANRNHFAALLYFTLPFTAAWAIGMATERHRSATIRAAIFVFLFAILMLGLGMARSRAGLILAAIAAVWSVAYAWKSHRHKHYRLTGPLVAAGVVLGGILVLNFALLRILERLDTGISDDYRFEIARTSTRIARDFFPFGSGFGTFVPVYHLYESIVALRAVYANQAHNDWVQLILEGGAPAAALTVAFLAWLIFASRVWRFPPEGTKLVDIAIQRAASISIVLLLLHSTIDFPLRTTALMVLLAFACGLLVKPAFQLRRQHRGRRSRHSRGASAADLQQLRPQRQYGVPAP